MSAPSSIRLPPDLVAIARGDGSGEQDVVLVARFRGRFIGRLIYSIQFSLTAFYLSIEWQFH